MSIGAARITEAAEAFLSAVSGFDPGSASVADSVRVADLAARVEKAASGVRVLAASRAIGGGAHKEAGVADPVSWLARQGGTTGSEARQALELARSLDAHPETKDALLCGAVSVAQAKEITRLEREAPGQEHELLEVARTGDLTRLRDETRERRFSRTKPEELHKAQLAARRFRHWRDGLGMIRFDGALPPETGIPLVNRIEREAKRLRGTQRRQGSAERFEAHAADALVALASEGGGSGKGRTDLVIVCDLYAWRRGHARQGEPCHVIGGGPIPVSLAKELSEDAFLKCVLHDGISIHTVSHYGRHQRAELKTALDLGPVPAFSGRACVDCGRRGYGLEYDHKDPVANHGPTSYDNLDCRCYLCHQEKTTRDRAAGLLGRKAQRFPPTGNGPSKPGERRTSEQRTSAEVPNGKDPPGHDPP